MENETKKKRIINKKVDTEIKKTFDRCKKTLKTLMVVAIGSSFSTK